MSKPAQIGETEKPRKPDYKVGALNKRTDRRGNIGAAWKNEDETITVVLNDFLVIEQDGYLLITLFPEKPLRG